MEERFCLCVDEGEGVSADVTGMLGMAGESL
jgi:hypothetical protein